MVVGLGHKQRLMGTSAKNQWIMNYKSTLYGFKILLGRKFADPFVQNEIKKLPFTLVELKNGNIGIKVSHCEQSMCTILLQTFSRSKFMHACYISHVTALG